MGAVQTVQPKWSHQSHQTGKQYSQSIKTFSNRIPSAYLCPALRTDGVYFCIYFVFWLFWLLGPFPNGAVHELNQDDAHDQAGDDLDPGVKGKHLDPHRAESEGLGRGIFFNFRGSSESQICFWHRLWDSWTQEDAQKHLFSMFLRSQMSKPFNGTTIEGLHFNRSIWKTSIASDGIIIGKANVINTNTCNTLVAITVPVSDWTCSMGWSAYMRSSEQVLRSSSSTSMSASSPFRNILTTLKTKHQSWAKNTSNALYFLHWRIFQQSSLKSLLTYELMQWQWPWVQKSKNSENEWFVELNHSSMF